MTKEIASGLLAGMLNKPLYVALRRPADLTRLDELLEAHLRWAIATEGRGELFASGPFIADGAVPGTLGGLTIVRAASEDEARDILAKDPLVEHGVVSIELKCWLLMEGSISLNARLSNQSSRLY